LVSRYHLYWILVLALAAVSAFYASPYGVLQIALLTVVASIIGIRGITSVEGEWHPQQNPPILRSRILHYVGISKVKVGSSLQQTAGNPFEASLLGHPKWSQFTTEELRNLSRSIFMQNQPQAANLLIHNE
jgi:hypothetical protein